MFIDFRSTDKNKYLEGTASHIRGFLQGEVSL